MSHGRMAVVALLLVAAISAMSPYLGSSRGMRDGQVEIYSWWTGPGEDDGSHAMVGDFEARNPAVHGVGAAVRGGDGSNAEGLRASRLLAGAPRNWSQGHAGLELPDEVRWGRGTD